MMEIDSTSVTPIGILSPGLLQRVVVTTLGSPIWFITVVGVDDGGWQRDGYRLVAVVPFICCNECG